MSDDRFKQARKSLIDRNKERQGDGEQESGDDKGPEHDFGA